MRGMVKKKGGERKYEGLKGGREKRGEKGYRSAQHPI